MNAWHAYYLSFGPPAHPRVRAGVRARALVGGSRRQKSRAQGKGAVGPSPGGDRRRSEGGPEGAQATRRGQGRWVEGDAGKGGKRAGGLTMIAASSNQVLMPHTDKKGRCDEGSTRTLAGRSDGPRLLT
jgi:hypothetical protein